MELMVGEILLKALVLCGILYLVARNEADFEFSKVAIVTAGITLGTFFIDLLLMPHISYFAAVVDVLFVAWMVWKFCWAPFWKAVIVAVLFGVISILMTMGVVYLTAKMLSPMEGANSRMEENRQEALQIYKEMMGGAPTNLPGSTNDVPSAPPSTPPSPTPASAPKPAPPPKPAPAPAPVPPAEAPKPDDNTTVIDSPEMPGSTDHLQVTAVLRDSKGQQCAIVNGKIIEVGGVVDVKVGRATYRWKLISIKNGVCSWEPVP